MTADASPSGTPCRPTRPAWLSSVPDRGLVALDDRGAIVGHAGATSSVAVPDGWTESELALLLTDQSRER